MNNEMKDEQILKDICYLLVPFLYEEAKPLKEYLHASDGNILQDLMYISCINAVFKKTKVLSCTYVGDKRIDFVCFETGIGFAIIKSDSATEIYNDVEKQSGELSDYLNRLDKIKFFPTSGIRKCIVFNMVIQKLQGNDEDGLQFGEKLYRCKLETNNCCIYTNHERKTLDKDKEKEFREKYEKAMLMMTLLLHHERQGYLLLREKIVLDNNENADIVQDIKKKILNLISCYSFTIASENEVLQKTYHEYRNILMLSEYERSMSELVFKFDDEIEKKAEKKFTWISIFIAAAGLISVFLEIVHFFN